MFDWFLSCVNIIVQLIKTYKKQKPWTMVLLFQVNHFLSYLVHYSLHCTYSYCIHFKCFLMMCYNHLKTARSFNVVLQVVMRSHNWKMYSSLSVWRAVRAVFSRRCWMKNRELQDVYLRPCLSIKVSIFMYIHWNWICIQIYLHVYMFDIVWW